MNAAQTVTLRTGRHMPVLGLGTWMLKDDTAGTVADALRLGYRQIDTSGDYGTQRGIGEALRRTEVDRREIFLVTKVEEDDDAYDATRRNLDELGQEYADLMLIHRPPPTGAGVELWEGLIRARDEGLARDIGVSNYSAGDIDELARATGETPAVNQIEWTPFGWSPELLEWSAAHRIVIQAYSPLTQADRLDDATLREIAAGYNKAPAQVLIRWNLQRGVVPIPKANHADHQAENLDVFDFELADDDLTRLDALNQPKFSDARTAGR